MNGFKVFSTLSISALVLTAFLLQGRISALEDKINGRLGAMSVALEASARALDESNVVVKRIAHNWRNATVVFGVDR